MTNKRPKAPTKAAAEPQQQQQQQAEDDRQTLSIGFYPDELDSLDRVVAKMRRDPKIRSLHTRIGRAKAVRHVLAEYCREHAADLATG